MVDNDNLLDFVRGLVRPILTFIWTISWIAFVYCTYVGGGDMGDVPLLYTGFVFAWNAEWAGERFLKNFVGKQ